MTKNNIKVYGFCDITYFHTVWKCPKCKKESVCDCGNVKENDVFENEYCEYCGYEHK